MTISAIAELLGGRKVLRKDVETTSELVDLTRAGLPVDILNTVAGELDMQRVVLAKLLGISERTLSRRVTINARLTAEESDRMVRLARVLALAKETLGDMQKAGRWLQTPNRALEGDRPFDRLDTDAGVRSVEQVLGRIAYGVYS
ncbi:MAG TPA: antitoxin Xre/MbcA/ParS toxin-binding domain-containing protein [Bryobacteraceae bacterium]|nr:antitoxin Xre/MbcA/ParS toxin-binding domain-containing protein [Bryobacteraceae bacterium]